MNYKELIARKKLHQLIDNSQSGSFLIFLILFVFYILNPQYDINCTIWIILTSIIIAVRLFTNTKIKKNIDTEYNFLSLQRYYDFGSIIISFCLGYLPLFLINDTQLNHRYAYGDYIDSIYILLISIVPGSIVTHGVRIQSFMSFVGPLTACLLISGFLGKATNYGNNSIHFTLIYIIPLAGAIFLARRQDKFYTKLFLNELQLEESNEKLTQIASKDALTSLANRRGYDQYFVSEWHRHKRSGASLSLLIIDIDHFKEFNDNYGHIEGDNCLTILANTIQKNLKRPGDLACRYGGEEFTVILPDTDQDGALEVGNDICSSIENLKIRHEFSKTSSYVTVSIGIASISPTEEHQLTDFFKQADNQLYLAKQTGRNKVCIESF